jgi:hypothetical protein
LDFVQQSLATGWSKRLRESPPQPCQIEFQAGQGLPKLIVQLTCNSASLFFYSSLHLASLVA